MKWWETIQNRISVEDKPKKAQINVEIMRDNEKFKIGFELKINQKDQINKCK